MATVIVKDNDGSVLMEETVLPDHLDNDHAAVQLLERLAWSIEDAHGQRRRMREIVRRQPAYCEQVINTRRDARFARQAAPA